MAYATAVKPAVEVKTCATCPYFNNFQEPEYIDANDGSFPNPRYGCGWCNRLRRFDFGEAKGGELQFAFDHQARKHHQQTNDCIVSSDLAVSHELEDNLDIFVDIDLEELEAFPTEEVTDEVDKPHSEYEVGSIVKIIDADEDHTEWGVFEVIDCKYNQNLYQDIETYLQQPEWYYRLSSNKDANAISKSLWVAENEICHFDMSHNVCTKDIF